jgi:hypothetical protein
MYNQKNCKKIFFVGVLEINDEKKYQNTDPDPLIGGTDPYQYVTDRQPCSFLTAFDMKKENIFYFPRQVLLFWCHITSCSK